jgi:hypothetical protein
VELTLTKIVVIIPIEIAIKVVTSQNKYDERTLEISENRCSARLLLSWMKALPIWSNCLLLCSGESDGPKYVRIPMSASVGSAISDLIESGARSSEVIPTHSKTQLEIAK